MTSRNILLIALCLLLTLALVTAVFANSVLIQSTWTVIAGGGGKAQAGEIQIQHTIGQGVGGSARGPDLELGSGYWPGVLGVAPPPSGNDIYLPMISDR